MKRLALALCLLASPAWADDASDMKQAAAGFYSMLLARHDSGIPDAGAQPAYSPFVTPQLATALARAAQAEQRFAARNKNAPPLLEGHIFSSLFEGPTGFSVGQCVAESQQGHCAIDLVYDDRKAAPTRWTDRLVMVKTQAGWRVDDIVYGGNWSFANTGSLGETLKMAAGLAGG